MSSLELLLGLLEASDPVFIAWEDFLGPDAPAIRRWQKMGFVEGKAGANPYPACPYCNEGVPYLVGNRCLCNRCFSTVDPHHLLLWPLNRLAFLRWFARKLRIRGGVRSVDEQFWQLGRYTGAGLLYECFFRLSDTLSARNRNRLLAYRNALLFRALPIMEAIEGFEGLCLTLSELLRQDRLALRVTDLAAILHGRNAVRFEAASGTLRAGSRVLGHVKPGSKAYHFLDYLRRHVGQVVPYADISQYVMEQSGSRNTTTDEATYCQKLKSAAKKLIPKIDSVLAPTNKGLGYQLRIHAGEEEGM